jgi:hypothetical protein
MLIIRRIRMLLDTYETRWDATRWCWLALDGSEFGFEGDRLVHPMPEKAGSDG